MSYFTQNNGFLAQNLKRQSWILKKLVPYVNWHHLGPIRRPLDALQPCWGLQNKKVKKNWTSRHVWNFFHLREYVSNMVISMTNITYDFVRLMVRNRLMIFRQILLGEAQICLDGSTDQFSGVNYKNKSFRKHVFGQHMMIFPKMTNMCLWLFVRMSPPDEMKTNAVEGCSNVLRWRCIPILKALW